MPGSQVEQSTVNKYTDKAKQKLFKTLLQDLNKEFKKSGGELVKTHGTSTVKKEALEMLNKTITSHVTKKMENVEYTDAIKVKDQFTSISKDITKEAKKTDDILKTADNVVTGFGALFKKGNKTQIVGSILQPVKETLDKCDNIVDKFNKDMEMLDYVTEPTSCWRKLKRKFINICGMS